MNETNSISSRDRTLYRLFKVAALDDQREYYRQRVERSRRAARQVNIIRAFFAFLTGLVSALAGLLIYEAERNGTLEVCSLGRLQALVQDVAPASTDTPDLLATLEAAAEATETAAAAPATTSTAAVAVVDCSVTDWLVPLLLVIAVVAPALGAAFTNLADLFQWDRTVTIYEAALENLEKADAQSPVDIMDGTQYRASLNAYAEGTLVVMRDETAQWGQLIKTPESLQKYIDQATPGQEPAPPPAGGE